MTEFKTTSDDGTNLRIVRWGDADRDILLVHGLAEHAGRYQHVAEALVGAGWRVTLVELRGHGHSEGKRGHVKFWHRYVEDLQQAGSMINQPYVLVAHSMGGLVALSALLEPQRPAIRAVALSNPLLGVAIDPPALKIKAAGFLSKWLPSLSMSNELETSMISRDPEVVRTYERDSLVFSSLTPRWYTEMRNAQEEVHAAAGDGTIPLRMMVSDGDQICDHKAAVALAERWGGPTETVVYPELYHELFNEPEKDKVLAELITWLDGLE